jgi:hypothetical protein
MGCLNKGLHKTVLLSAIGKRPRATHPPNPTISYTPTVAMPFGSSGPRFPTAPSSWGFGPHTAAYQCTNNIPSPQRGKSMMANNMTFNNGYN